MSTAIDIRLSQYLIVLTIAGFIIPGMKMAHSDDGGKTWTSCMGGRVDSRCRWEFYARTSKSFVVVECTFSHS